MAKPKVSNETPSKVLFLGAPDAGKTNFLGRLSVSLIAGKGMVAAPEIPQEIGYVDQARAHLETGRFAPRSNPASEGSFVAHVTMTAGVDAGQTAYFEVPDAVGEIWRDAVVEREIAPIWMDRMREARGAILCLRLMSEEHVDPLDWVNSAEWMRHPPGAEQAADELTAEAAEDVQANEEQGAESDEIAEGVEGDDEEESKEPKREDLPTQVLLTELLNFLEAELGVAADERFPRLAIIVTAWDLAPPEVRASSIESFLWSEFPMFAGRLDDCERLQVKLFGCSVVGGDLTDDEEFQEKYKDMELETAGYLVVDNSAGKTCEITDFTWPLSWALGAQLPPAEIA